MTSRRFLTIALLFFSFSLTAQPSPDTLVVLYTNGSYGHLEACPCSEESLGGLAKRMFVVNETRKRHGDNVLLVDGGNLFSSYPRNLAEEKLLADLVAEMRYDAVNVGEFDFTYGATFMRETTAALPMVSATVFDKMRRAIASSYRLKTLAGRRIAVVGILAESAFQLMQDAAKPELAVAKSATALAETIETARQEKPDAIVLLLRSFDDMIEKHIAETYPDIVVVVSNDEQFAKSEVVKFGETIVACAGHDGEHIGKLTLIFSEKKIVASTNQLIPLSPTAKHDDDMHRKIQAFKQTKQLDAKTKLNSKSNGN